MKRALSILSLVVLLLSFVVPLAVFADGGEGVRVNDDWSSNPIVSQDSLAVASGNGLVCATWVDGRDYLNPPNGTASNIYASCSSDSGQTWSANVRVSDTPGFVNEYMPSIDGKGTVHIVWVDLREGGDYKIYHSFSTDRGSTWSVGTPVPGVDFAFHPVLVATHRGGVALAWNDHGREVRVAEYVNHEWEGSYVAYQSSNNISGVDLTVRPNGTVGVVWQEKTDYTTNIIATRTSDLGDLSTWSEVTIIDSGANQYFAQQPSIVASASGFAIAWQRCDKWNNKCSIYVARSDDWIDNLQVVPPDATNVSPLLISRGSSLVIGYADGWASNQDYYALLLGGGKKTIQPNFIGSSYEPGKVGSGGGLAMMGDTLVMVTSEWRSGQGYDIYAYRFPLP